jgi:tRNA C32,U32 (ribose-2'-O)-methylase TrmJ
MKKPQKYVAEPVEVIGHSSPSVVLSPSVEIPVSLGSFARARAMAKIEETLQSPTMAAALAAASDLVNRTSAQGLLEASWTAPKDVDTEIERTALLIGLERDGLHVERVSPTTLRLSWR